MLKKLNNLRGRISYNALPITCLVIVCAILVASWFRHGFLYGGGDVGLPTYDPVRLLSIVKNIWWDVHAPGFPYPSALTSIPLYIGLSLLQIVGFTPVAMQAFLFGILLFLSGFGMYFLFQEITTARSKALPFIAAIFYMLNPYVVVQVWHRFVHTAFFLTALLPILTFIYIKIIKTHRLSWLLGFLTTSFIFTYTYGSVSFMAVIWIPIVIYSLWKCLEVRNKKNILEIFKIFSLVFLSWILINAWWLYPFWTTGPAIYSQVHSLYASISTLLSLSNQSSMPMVLRGINPFYTFGDEAWVAGYDHPLMQLISWTIPLITLVGIYSIVVYKKRHLYVWLLLFLLAIFVSKGVAAPFGHPFLLFFSKSFLLGAFRNPFEKFGILIPFASAFIFPIGIEKSYIWLRLKFIRKEALAIFIILILLALEFVVYPWPIWAGKIFGNNDQSAFVKIPENYKKADSWITNQGKSGRILHLPFVSGDAVTYSWENKYNGVEPSSLLFQTPSVSSGFGLEQIDDSLVSINTVFTVDNFDERKVENVLSSLNIRYLVLHKDVDWKARGLIDPIVIETLLSKTNFIKKNQEFGDLVIYEIGDSLFIPKVFTSQVSNVLSGGSSGFSVWPEIYENKNWPVLFTTPINGNEESLLSQTDLNFSATPTQIIETPTSPLAYKENALAELPSPRFLPGSPFYPLILLKEKIQLLSSPALDKHFIQLEQAGKRLAEAHALTIKGNKELANRAITDYMNKFNRATKVISQRQMGGLINDYEKLTLKTIFARHEIVLRELGSDAVLENSKLKLSSLGLAPYYDLKEDFGMSKYGRKVYRFDLQKGDRYEILFKNSDRNSSYLGSLEKVAYQIDNEVRVLEARQGKEFLSFGVIELNKGLHEISYNIIDSVNLSPEIGSSQWETNGLVNLVEDSNQPAFELQTTKENFSSVSFKIENFDKNDLYRIDFEYWTKNGQGPILQVLQDSDWDFKGKRFLAIDKLYDRNNYSFYWNSASIFFEPRANTKEAIIKIVGEPWNNCQAILVDFTACQNQEVRKAYNRGSDFLVKNVSVKRLLVNDMYLKSLNVDSESPQTLKEVDIKQLSPSKYQGKLLLEQPSSLIFLTTFHPEWKVSLTKDGKTETLAEGQHFLVNGYANLWYLDQDPGEYMLNIEFLPQKRFKKGILFSVVGIGAILVLGMRFLKHKEDD